MKTLTFILLIISTLTVLGQENKDISNEKVRLINSWYFAEGELEGLPMTIRFRDSLKNIFESNLYDFRVDISADFRYKISSGLPSEKDSVLMVQAEKLIVESLENDLQSVLACVYTWNNSRTWYVYTKSIEELQTRISKALISSDLPVRLSMSMENDKYWNEYKDIIEGSGFEMK